MIILGCRNFDYPHFSDEHTIFQRTKTNICPRYQNKNVAESWQNEILWFQIQAQTEAKVNTWNQIILSVYWVVFQTNDLMCSIWKSVQNGPLFFFTISLNWNGYFLRMLFFSTYMQIIKKQMWDGRKSYDDPIRKIYQTKPNWRNISCQFLTSHHNLKASNSEPNIPRTPNKSSFFFLKEWAAIT